MLRRRERNRMKLPAGSLLADCGNSLPPQDAAIGNPENHWRFQVLPKWKKVVDGFFYGQHPLLRSCVLLFVLGLLTVAMSEPAEAWPRAERVAERRLARAEQAAVRAESRVERLRPEAAGSVPLQTLRPGVVRRLLRQGMTPEEIARISGGGTVTPGMGTVQVPLAGRVTQPAGQPEEPRQIAGGEMPQPLATAEKRPQAVQPAAVNDRAVQAAADDRDDGTRSVLVTGVEPMTTAAEGPIFPGLSTAKATDGKPAAVVTHEPIELLPAPKPQQ